MWQYLKELESVLDDIKRYNPSFDINMLLLRERNRYERIEHLKKSIWYPLYKAIDLDELNYITISLIIGDSIHILDFIADKLGVPKDQVYLGSDAVEVYREIFIGLIRDNLPSGWNTSYTG